MRFLLLWIVIIGECTCHSCDTIWPLPGPRMSILTQLLLSAPFNHLPFASPSFTIPSLYYRMHIAHSIFWENEEGRQPDPYTTISYQDVEDGIWLPRDRTLVEYCRNYIKSLEMKGKPHPSLSLPLLLLCMVTYTCTLTSFFSHHLLLLTSLSTYRQRFNAYY